mmetsp:Transcript_24603/g.34382  ORF Transcript_24603/g.34382 Transcript_24603/m.34382 type:complete len:356 (+) Transcript_24603:141-1208(+)|eukprot:CAMPEP_0185264820 /NCGR_PEP_ID=MMETSP1359-20130426/25041_1 /TAXON_ID=552665 /ORGANISM="Bigelowiella longifila, Strain CCMP242" /LENGTH=355 /DNA_ID=CAMNT_0027853677 /DNA_START=123 /DNA_END=1190 /DNA_ORIENTATION=-
MGCRMASNARDSNENPQPDDQGMKHGGGTENRQETKTNGADLQFSSTKVVAKGSFGVVFKATLSSTGEQVAIKKVLQDPRYKNRELQILRILKHPNIVTLKNFFYAKADQDGIFLNLVMEYIPYTVHYVMKKYMNESKSVPTMATKVYMYQIFRALQYIHSIGVCHRDIKPHNLLVDTRSHVCKICDFGSAKILEVGQRNVAYICSRYYRAPELVLDAVEYTTAIDMWSAGCVFAEFFLGNPIFLGRSKREQLTEIMKILGTPSEEDCKLMNPKYPGGQISQMFEKRSWPQFWGKRAPVEAIDLMDQILCYRPTERLTATKAMEHKFFDAIRSPEAKMPDGKSLPPLFDEQTKTN